MQSQSHQMEEALFAGALALPPENRTTFLQRACGGDRTLHENVESLLRQHEAENGALDAESPGDRADMARTLLAEAAVHAATPEHIGPYHLREKIGEGGFGVVWRAEQSAPVERRVALKIIRPGMDAREFVARFEIERQALALMEHPNIARMFDGGTTEDGRPFFVMELVQGIPITTFCDEQKLETEARLHLFVQVCRAVQHAHQKGIIHRDLKPSNILVARQDGVPVPKIIDFGIAKATGGRIADATLTLQAQVMGTPAYMSPEQLEPGRADVDTRSDIYNLGVLLYELLTGQPPFDTKQLAAKSFDELRQIIREQEPLKPSTRLSLLGPAAREEIAQSRSAEFARLGPALRGDLDWIVMCCLEKNRARRYDTANTLARDIERHLSHQPVLARPPTAGYLLRKTIRRHRVACIAGTGIAASLALAAFANAIETRRANAERDRAAQVTQAMKSMLRGVGPQVALGRDTAMLRGIVDDFRIRVRRELSGDPAIHAELTETLGLAYSDIGEDAMGHGLLREALTAHERLHGRESLPVARVLDEMGQILMRRNRWYEPHEFLAEALAIRRRLLGPRHPQTLETLAALGRTEGASDPATGEPKLREALTAQRAIFGSRHPAVARTLLMLGQVLRRKEGEIFLNEAGAIYRETTGPQSAEVLEVNCALGACLVEQRRHDDAEKILRQTLADSAGFLSPAHPVRLDAILWLSYGLIRGKERAAEAEPLLRQGIALAQRAENSRCAQLVLALKGVLMDRNDLAGAEEVMREAVAVARPLAADDPLRLAAHLASLVEVWLRLERFVEAEAAARECLAIRTRHDKHGWLTQSAHRLLGVSLAGQGKIAEAETSLLAGFNGLREVVERFPNQARGAQAETIVELVRLYRGAGRAAEALAWLKQGVDLSRAWEAGGEAGRAAALMKKLNSASDTAP